MINQQFAASPSVTVAASDAAFSRRNWRGKYVQRLILDTAHALMGVLHVEGQTSNSPIGIIRSSTSCALAFNPKDAQAPGAHVSIGVLTSLALLTDALARQIYRLTGCSSFTLSTWDNYLLTQPVSLVLFAADGQELQYFNPTFSANTYFHGLIDLFDDLEAKHGGGIRTPDDLTGLAAGTRISDWTAGPGPRQTSLLNATGSIKLPMDKGLASLRQSLSDTAVPKSVQALETYEASMGRGIVRRTARFGQDDALATGRTERRFEALNPNLSADLKPLSRSLKDTNPDELIGLANDRPLTHLAIEFGVSDVAIKKRLKKLGWVSPRRKMRAA